MKRRKFIDFFLGGAGIGAFLSLLYPVVRYLTPPPQKEEEVQRVVAGRVGELTPNSAKIFRFGSTPALLLLTADGVYKAFSAVCTHLTCTVGFDSATGTILCPCHNGRFDLNGAVISGPPPKPLETLRVEVSGEEILVSKERA